MSSPINGYKSELQRTDLPPGAPGKPYVISSQDGEIIYIPISKSATRLLVTGKESENAFAVVASGGSQSDPIGFHYHRETHDVFLCLQGSINVWAGDKCRTMTSGDFASVPPVSSFPTQPLVAPCSINTHAGNRTPVPSQRSAFRVRRADHTRWLGGILPLHWRAILRADVADER